MAVWNQSSPLGLWLLRSSAGRPRAPVLISTGILAIGLSIADSAGYLPRVSYAIALFLVVIAAPHAAFTVLRMDENGQLDQLRLSGARDAPLLAAVFWGLTAPLLVLGGAFLIGGVAAGSVAGRQLAALLLAFGMSMTISAGVLSSARLIRARGGQILLASVIVVGGMGAVASSELRLFPWEEWISDYRVWPAIAVGQTVLMLAFTTRLMRVLRRPVAGREPSGQLRRLLPTLPFQRSPLLMRGLVQSHAGALFSFILAIVAIVGIRFIATGSRDTVITAASLAAYFPLPMAILAVFNQCRLDAESGRLQLIRCAPIPVALATIPAIAGLCAPFVLATCVAGLAVWLLFGASPELPIVAAMMLATVAPAAAAEGWLVLSKIHLVGFVTAAPFVFIMQSAQAPLVEVLTVYLLIGWIPWAAAIAALRNPARPILSEGVATVAIAAVAFLALQRTFVTPIRFHGDGLVFCAGLIVAAPLLGVHERGIRRSATVAAIVGVGLMLITVKSYPWLPGLAATATVALGLWAGGHVDRQWPSAGSPMIRMLIAYIPLIGGMLLDNFFPGRNQLSAQTLASAVYLTTATLMIVALAATDVAAVIVARRHAAER